MGRHFSPKFKATIYRLLLTGIIVLVCVPLGMFAYLTTNKNQAQAEIKRFEAEINQASTHDVTIVIDDKRFLIHKTQIKTWIEAYTRGYSGQKDLRFSERMTDYVVGLARQVDHDPIDAKFMFEDGKAKEFIAAQPGHKLDIQAAVVALRNGLLTDSPEIILTTQTIPPSVTLEKINELGINSLLAKGESDFSGSSPARLQNIKVASAKYNGLIIDSGKTFSFNEILGPVDATGGYAPEKVIKNGGLQYEYGGGICQVSTTLFRAAMYAGLPIVERRGHAFAVAYYKPAGFDATIYPGVTDMKFTNNTSGHILLQTKIVGTKISFEIYGTSDGRKVTIDGPNPYDQRPDGSLKTTLTRNILFIDGTTKQDVFKSIYRSPLLYTVEKNPYE